jgi:hypothetical protein
MTLTIEMVGRRMSPVLREWIGKHSRFCVTFKGGYIKPQHHVTHGLLLIKPENVMFIGRISVTQHLLLTVRSSALAADRSESGWTLRPAADGGDVLG